MKNQMSLTTVLTLFWVALISLLFTSCDWFLSQKTEVQPPTPKPISSRPIIPISNEVDYGLRCVADRVYYEILTISDDTSTQEILDNKDLVLESGKSKTFLPPGYRRIIPVVFHVVHQCGVEEIQLQQVQQAVEELNKDFHGEHLERLRDTLDPFYDSIAVMKFVEFKLATLDPHGNATTGVNWLEHYSSISGSGLESELKHYVQWPPEEYLNVWVVSSTGGSAYAQYPWVSEGLGNEWKDGIVISHNYLGTTGTSEAWYHKRRKILTHEVGHWLGLRHTWGDSLSFLSPGDTLSCPAGDGIKDTPTTIGSSVIIYPRYPNIDTIVGLHNPDSLELGLSFKYDDVWNEADETYYPTFYDLSPYETITIDTNKVYNFPNTCDDGTPYDNIYNFMDYGCEIMFTRDQINFMTNTLLYSKNREKIGLRLDKTTVPDARTYTLLTLDNYFFQEADQNDGAIKNEIVVKLSEGKWGPAWNTNATNIFSTDLPEGLTIKAKKIDDTTLKIALEGKAIHHNDANDIPFSFTICGDRTNCITGQTKPYWNGDTVETEGGDSMEVIHLKGLTLDFKDEGTLRHTIYKNRVTPDSYMCLTDAVDHYIGFGFGIYRYLDLYSHKHLEDPDTIRPEGFYLTKEGGSKIEVVALKTDDATIALLDKEEELNLTSLNNDYKYLDLTRGVEKYMLALDKDLEGDETFPTGTKYIGLRFTFDCNQNYYYGWLRLEFSQVDGKNKICLIDSYYDAQPDIQGDNPTKEFVVGKMTCPGNVVDADSTYFIKKVAIDGQNFSPNSSSFKGLAQLKAGKTVNLQLHAGRPAYTANWWVYADKNGDKVFDLEKELVLHKLGISDPFLDTLITIPAEITATTYRIRVVSALYGYDGHFNDYVLSPCGNISKYGSFLDLEVENKEGTSSF